MTWEAYHNWQKPIQSAASHCRKSPFYLVKRYLLKAENVLSSTSNYQIQKGKEKKNRIAY